MRALITGIGGFVGRYLERELSSQGFTVFGTSHADEQGKVYHMDLDDPHQIDHVLAASTPEVIFHLAGLTSVAEAWSHPDEAMRVNRDGTDALYAAIVRRGLDPLVLVTGTAEVYAPSSSPLTERHSLGPSNPYAISKLEQERVTQRYPMVRTIITRSFPHLGPGQSPRFALAGFAQQIVAVERGERPDILVGNLDAIRDYTDVRDVVRAYRLLALKGSPGVYNVCSGQGWTMKSLLDRLVVASSSRALTIRIDPQRLRPSDTPVLIGDNTKLLATVDWRAQIPITTTLVEMLEFFRQHE